MSNVVFDNGFAPGYFDEIKSRITWGIKKLKLSNKKFRVSPVKGNGNVPSFNFTRSNYYLPADQKMFNRLFSKEKSMSKVLFNGLVYLHQKEEGFLATRDLDGYEENTFRNLINSDQETFLKSLELEPDEYDTGSDFIELEFRDGRAYERMTLKLHEWRKNGRGKYLEAMLSLPMKNGSTHKFNCFYKLDSIEANENSIEHELKLAFGKGPVYSSTFSDRENKFSELPWVYDAEEKSHLMSEEWISYGGN